MVIILSKMPYPSCIGHLCIVSCWQIIPSGREGGFAQDNILVSETLYLKTFGLYLGLDYRNFSNIGTDPPHSVLSFFNTWPILFMNNNELF